MALRRNRAYLLGYRPYAGRGPEHRGWIAQTAGVKVCSANWALAARCGGSSGGGSLLSDHPGDRQRPVVILARDGAIPSHFSEPLPVHCDSHNVPGTPHCWLIHH